MGPMPEQQLVAVSANQCLESFQKCLLQASSVHARELSMVENQVARFSTWANGIGAFAPGRASMDHRLRYAPEVRSVVNGLLESLDYRIRNCSDILGNAGNSPRLDAPSISDPALEQTFVNMATEISRLNKMSNAIRRASKEIQVLKASDFQIKDEDGNNVEPSLLGHFEHHIRDRFPDASEEIQKRLTRVMLLRRKRILHRRHRYGSSTVISPYNEVPTASITLPKISSAKAGPKQDGSQPVAIAMHQTTPSQVKSATTLVADAYKKVISSPSVISASKTVALGSHEVLCFPPAPGHTAKRKFERLKAKYLADHEAVLRSTEKESLHVADESQHSKEELDYSFDEQYQDFLSTELQVIGEILCPYCLTALPAEEVFSQQKWETHVKNDLDPYVCLFENCNQPDELYSHSEGWFAHLNQHSQRWRCSLQHNLDPSTTREQYIQHLRDVHNSKLSDAQLRVLANKSARKVAKLFQSCPLCGKDESQVDGRLEAHIVGHLRSLAIKSLPSYEEDIPDNNEFAKESVNISRPQSRTTVKDLQDVSLLASGTNSTLDELMNELEQDENSNMNFLGVPHSEIDPEHQAWSNGWPSYLGDFTSQKNFPSGEDDAILLSILEQQQDKATMPRGQARDDLEPPSDRDESDASKANRNESPEQDQANSISESDDAYPPPTRPKTYGLRTMPPPPTNTDRSEPHWAEHVFAEPPSSHTEMHESQRSRARGPFVPADAAAYPVPTAARTLVRLTFDDEKLSLAIIINAANSGPYLVLTVNTGGIELFSHRGVHEICIHQLGNTVRLKRWSHSIQGPTLWAVLSFVTWEEIVLFHCTFIALKARSHLTVLMDPREYKFPNEKRLFQAQIIDDGFQHALVVYEDIRTRAIRLHASVWNGELQACPVWTAFVTNQSVSSRWLTRKSKHRIWIQEIKLYVFCNNYKEANMRSNKVGAFEVNFVNDEAAGRFQEVFYPAPVPEPGIHGEEPIPSSSRNPPPSPTSSVYTDSIESDCQQPSSEHV